MNKLRILFVCMGNICRSPLAESIFRHQVRARGVEDLFEIDSAGTSGYHCGAAPDDRTVETAAARGVDVSGASRQVTPDDLQTFDYVIVMDRENLSNVERLYAGKSRGASVHLLREWDHHDIGSDVPDPYYGGVSGFGDVHDMVERCCSNLIHELLAKIGR